MCTVLLPPGVNPIAVNKYIISRDPEYPLDRKLGHRHIRYGRFEEESPLHPVGNRTKSARSSRLQVNQRSNRLKSPYSPAGSTEQNGENRQ